MDHLNIGTTIEVKHYDDVEYDHQGFHQFPARHGLTRGAANSWLFGDSPLSCLDDSAAVDTSNLNAVVQSWLFFGLLSEVLGVEVGVDELTRCNGYGELVICTKALPDLLEAWKTRVLEKKRETVGQLIRSQLALDEAFEVVSRHCTFNTDDTASQWPIDKFLALSLAVLGETLSNAQNDIVKTADVRIDGWNNSCNTGWGYSKHVITEMERDFWCPHSLHMLQRILQQSSSGLLCAQKFCQPKALRLDHRRCTYQQCNDRGNAPYRLKHWESNDDCRCEAIHVDLVSLLDLLGRNKLPLLLYKEGEKIVRVVEKKSDMKYAIMSHVVADGFGNRKENSLPACRLKYFVRAFERIIKSGHQLRSDHFCGSPSVPMYFWIDTLAIPVAEDYDVERSFAISNMHKMYIDAAYTIVFDAGLMTQTRGGSYSETALKLTTSYWITRLWTLQEAYLSRRVLFYFSDVLQDLDELQDTYVNHLTSPVPLASQSFFKAILGPERIDFKSTQTVSVSPRFLQALWNALQWRSTSLSEHEAQAIATLLKLDTSPFDVVSFNPSSVLVNTPIRSETPMQKLLQQIAACSAGAIPEGLIFTQGPKLSAKGFCWAPRSWLAAPDDPVRTLTRPQHGAKLTDHGLEVTFPGFRLHDILASTGKRGDCSKGLTIPVNRQLAEWMVIKGDCSALHQAEHENKYYAVITESVPLTARHQPGLLLKMNGKHAGTERADIVAHVTIKQETDSDERVRLQKEFQEGKGSQFCGECFSEQTCWCVDGYCPPLRPLFNPVNVFDILKRQAAMLSSGFTRINFLA